jgi:hypothetical protein
MRQILVFAVAALVVLAAARGPATSAQVSDEYQIAVAITTIEQPVFVRGVSNLGEALKTLTAKVGGTTCATVTLTGAAQDVILHIGSSGQPAACGVEGATVTLVDGDGHTLATSFVLRKGTRDRLINFAPLPPGSPQERKPNPAGPMQIVIPASIMAEHVSGAPDEDTIGEFLGGTVSAFADSVFCSSVEVANISVDAVLLIGLDTQSPVCSLAGVALTFKADSGPDVRPIGPTWKVEPGVQRTLTMYGSPAIGDVFFVPPVTPVPPPIDLGPVVPPTPSRTSIIPPAAGDGGLLP